MSYSSNKNYNVDQVNADAKSKYHFLNNQHYNIAYTGPKGRDGAYLEAWQSNDEGAPDWPRDVRHLPLGTAGVEVFNSKVTPTDIAADVGSHLDPIQKRYTKQLIAGLSKRQLGEMKHQSGDYTYSLKLGMSEQQATNNAASALYRGYVYDQYPKEGLAAMHFTLPQRIQLDNATSYAISGNKVPKGQVAGLRYTLEFH